ncbi:MAG: ankyrin repeat domain-containing protein [Legionella sp.]|nr:ankyrin repeat domain-containing protein [Legionella sp.]
MEIFKLSELIKINKLIKSNKLSPGILSKITRLVITEELEEKPFKKLVKILPKLSSLKELTINNQKEKRIFADLFVVLPQCPNLYLLNLANNFIKIKDFLVLVDKLPSFPVIGAIMLDHNKLAGLNDLSEEEFNVVLTKIAESRTLHRLVLEPENYLDKKIIDKIEQILNLNAEHALQLFKAAADGDLEKLQTSIKVGNKINTKFIFPPNNVLQTCMHVAAYSGRLNILKFLIMHGAQNVSDGNGFTPLNLVEEQIKKMDEAYKKELEMEDPIMDESIIAVKNIEDEKYKKMRSNLLEVASFLKQKPMVKMASCCALFSPSKPPKTKLKEELNHSSETRTITSMKS